MLGGNSKISAEAAMCVLTAFCPEGHLPMPKTACWIKWTECLSSQIQVLEVYFLRKLLHLLTLLHTEVQMAAQIFSRSWQRKPTKLNVRNSFGSYFLHVSFVHETQLDTMSFPPLELILQRRLQEGQRLSQCHLQGGHEVSRNKCFRPQ